jgi:hypothetical protein
VLIGKIDQIRRGRGVRPDRLQALTAKELICGCAAPWARTVEVGLKTAKGHGAAMQHRPTARILRVGIKRELTPRGGRGVSRRRCHRVARGAVKRVFVKVGTDWVKR